MTRCALGCALFLALAAVPAATQAATITVTGTGDTIAVDDLVTLREAITSANNNANVNADVVAVDAYGTDTINFNISGAGVHTIAPTSALPTITDPTVIDGYTQPGASQNTLAVGDNAVLLIELDGTMAAGSQGLSISAGNSTVRGLVINRFSNGIYLVSAGNNLIEGNFIGTDPAGTLDRGNAGDGVNVSSGDGNLIGGTTPAARNIISGNNSNGVGIAGSGTLVRGNYVGTDKNGASRLANTQGIGVSVGGHNAIIGGSDADDGVVDGIVGARNVISGNDNMGIIIDTAGNGSLGAVTIQGNFIGLNAAGSAGLGNSIQGIDNDQRGRTGITTVGGTAAGAGNFISANGGRGIFNNAAGMVIQGNFIGPDVSGTVDLGNATDGITNSGINVIIGGSVPGARNVISGNGGNGITITASTNTVQGNFIGTQADGVSPLGNSGHGVSIGGNIGETIGGLSAGEGNTIAHNGQTGVTLGGGTSQGVLLGNSIFSNGGLGIDLGGDGVTPNDAGDPDAGPNNLQNFPVLTSVSSGGGSTAIAGTLNSAPNTTYRIEFFASDTIDPSGYGEGQSFAGSTNVTTDANGNASFNVSVPQIAAGRRVTATTTDPNSNTSEFSAAIGQLLNIATRLRVQTGDNVLIGGFIITGTDPKKVIVRGIGPSLSGSVPEFLADPTLELHDASGTLASNDNWKTRPDGSSQQAEIEATTIPPTNDLESALVRTLPANNAGYTAIVRGKNDTTGIGVIEAYDLDQAANSKLANISTRGFVETGNNVLIGGFIAGNGVTKVIVRAIGPTLTKAGVTNPLQDPTLELHDGSGATIRSNNNWKTREDGSGQQTEIEATTIPPTNDFESALVQTLAPGNYTAIVRGQNNTTGIAVVEVYNIP